MIIVECNIHTATPGERDCQGAQHCEGQERDGRRRNTPETLVRLLGLPAQGLCPALELLWQDSLEAGLGKVRLYGDCRRGQGVEHLVQITPSRERFPDALGGELHAPNLRGRTCDQHAGMTWSVCISSRPLASGCDGVAPQN